MFYFSSYSCRFLFLKLFVSVGDWTINLQSLITTKITLENSPTHSIPLEIHIEGPYGAPSVNINDNRYTVSVVIYGFVVDFYVSFLLFGRSSFEMTIYFFYFVFVTSPFSFLIAGLPVNLWWHRRHSHALHDESLGAAK
jgi:hypothetical protein